jgi:hypothetical protein
MSERGRLEPDELGSLQAVPASMVEHLREGLYRELALAGQEVADMGLVRSDAQRSAYLRAIGRMNAVWELFDEIGGWESTGEPVRVDMEEFGKRIVAVLRQHLEHQLEVLPGLDPVQRAVVERQVQELGDYIIYLQSQHA